MPMLLQFPTDRPRPEFCAIFGEACMHAGTDTCLHGSCQAQLNTAHSAFHSQMPTSPCPVTTCFKLMPILRCCKRALLTPWSKSSYMHVLSTCLPLCSLQTVYHMVRDAKVGFVQCRWTHNNVNSFLTWVQAIGLDFHFAGELTLWHGSGSPQSVDACSPIASQSMRCPLAPSSIAVEQRARAFSGAFFG